MKKICLILCLIFCGSLAARAQCSPFQSLGTTQFFDNNGVPLTNGVLYSFQAGTSTQQATFTDSTCTVANVNPITFTTGARVNIWLTTGNFYKFQLCLQNDGSTCAAGDVLFSVDNVPGGASGSSSGGGPPFITGSPNPATTGILRCASGDQCVVFRNAANSANLAISKDVNDVLTWAGGSLKFPAVATPSGLTTGFSWLWADSSAFRWKVSNNGGAAAQLVISGVDINTSDQVTQFHFGATATPLSGTAPTTNQFLQWNGTNIVGAGAEATMSNGLNLFGNSSLCTAGSNGCNAFILANSSHILVRITGNVATAPVGCGTNAVFGVRDLTSATTLSTITPTVTGILDSGALSVPMTAGHAFGVGVTTNSVGCSTQVNLSITATYE